MGRSTCIAVLGGGRCGTSLTAGILHNLGVHMGDLLLGRSPSNDLGHFEDLAFQELHKQIIGDWRNPKVSTRGHTKAYRALVQKREQLPLWGIKDPRLVFCFPLLLRSLSENTELRVIQVYRDPEIAAASMVRRSKREQTPHIIVTEEQALNLAYLYQGEIEKQLSKWEGDVLTVDFVELIQSPRYSVEQIAAFVGLAVTSEAIALIHPELKHL